MYPVHPSHQIKQNIQLERECKETIGIWDWVLHMYVSLKIGPLPAFTLDLERDEDEERGKRDKAPDLRFGKCFWLVSGSKFQMTFPSPSSYRHQATDYNRQYIDITYTCEYSNSESLPIPDYLCYDCTVWEFRTMEST